MKFQKMLFFISGWFIEKYESIEHDHKTYYGIKLKKPHNFNNNNDENNENNDNHEINNDDNTLTAILIMMKLKYFIVLDKKNKKNG